MTEKDFVQYLDFIQARLSDVEFHNLFLSLFEYQSFSPWIKKQAKKQTCQARRARIPRAISPR